jgi:hypothetical protein
MPEDLLDEAIAEATSQQPRAFAPSVNAPLG